MAEAKTMRLNKVLREFNISLDRAVEYLNSQGHEIEARPTTKISEDIYQVLFDEFQTDKSKKVASKEVGEEKRKEKEELRLAREKELEEKRKQEERQEVVRAKTTLEGPKQVGRIDLDKPRTETPKVGKPAAVEIKQPEQPQAPPVPKTEEAEKINTPSAETKEEKAPEVKSAKEEIPSVIVR